MAGLIETQKEQAWEVVVAVRCCCCHDFAAVGGPFGAASGSHSGYYYGANLKPRWYEESQVVKSFRNVMQWSCFVGD